MKTIVVLTGAGISAESGVKTFRESGGLWEDHDVMEVASPQGWARDPALVLDFYNQRRRQLESVRPNAAHLGLVQLENDYKVKIITQNVDDLHERAGSADVLHLHGELYKVRSTCDETDILPWKEDLNIGDLCKRGCQLRPHIVWFGEGVPMLDRAIDITGTADIFIIIGTSMQVYPAASLIHYVPKNSPIYLIDPRPTISEKSFEHLTIIPKMATEGIKELLNILKK